MRAFCVSACLVVFALAVPLKEITPETANTVLEMNKKFSKYLPADMKTLIDGLQPVDVDALRVVTNKMITGSIPRPASRQAALDLAKQQLPADLAGRIQSTNDAIIARVQKLQEPSVKFIQDWESKMYSELSSAPTDKIMEKQQKLFNEFNAAWKTLDPDVKTDIGSQFPECIEFLNSPLFKMLANFAKMDVSKFNGDPNQMVATFKTQEEKAN